MPVSGLHTIEAMRTLRRLLGHISNHLGMQSDETTIAALKATLDYFDRNPYEYLEIFHDGKRT